MTDKILASDIEAALKVLKAGGGEAEIAAALIRRKVAPTKAAEVASDLVQGRSVAAEAVPRPSQATAPRTLESQSFLDDDQPATSKAQSATRAPHSSKHRRRHRHYWLALLAVACLVLLGLVVFSYLGEGSRHRREQRGREIPPGGTTGPAARSAGAQSPATRSNTLTLQLRPDGLRLNNSPVTPANALGALSGVLGAPTRTNHIDESNQTFYGFDRHGLALQLPAEGSGASIILHFQGLGVAEGNQRPFSGLLQVEGQDIGADMDADTLAAIKPLQLTGGTNSSVLRGKVGSLGLTFMYLDSPRRLGFAEIDLE